MLLIPEVVQVLQSFKSTKEIEEAFQILKSRHVRLRHVEAATAIVQNTITTGTRVSFVGRRNQKLLGTVLKVNRTTATV